VGNIRPKNNQKKRDNLIKSFWSASCNFTGKSEIMNPRLLRTVLTWAAPFIIGYVVKKFEERQARKKQEKAPQQDVE